MLSMSRDPHTTRAAVQLLRTCFLFKIRTQTLIVPVLTSMKATYHKDGACIRRRGNESDDGPVKDCIPLHFGLLTPTLFRAEEQSAPRLLG